MAKYQAYAEYKDSGVEWLGKIPSHWLATQVKYGYLVTLGKMLQSTPKSSLDELKLYLKAQNIQPNGINIDQVESMWFSPDECKKLLLQKSDVLVSEGGDAGRSAIWNCELEECYIQNAINRVRPKYVNNSKYFLYWMKFLKSTDFIYIICNKATIAHYTAEKLEGSPIFLPSSDEQIAIANFLDHETAKIDHLIEKQKQLIELLKEKRQAVISHAVTKGLNPNVKMKDSGMKWLGEVPEHWDVLPIKYLTESVNTGGTPKNPISFTDVDEVNWFTPGDFLNDLEITVSSKYVTFDSVNTGDSKLYPRGSVLMIGIGATLGKIAICNTEFSCNQQINVLVPNRSIISEYLAYALIIQMDQIKQLSNSSTIGIINQEKTKQIVIALPALDEQVKIVEKITQKLLGFKKIIDLAEEQVELLKERRTALISAAVTGKIDVRHWQAPTVAEADTELSA